MQLPGSLGLHQKREPVATGLQAVGRGMGIDQPRHHFVFFHAGAAIEPHSNPGVAILHQNLEHTNLAAGCLNHQGKPWWTRLFITF